MQSCCSDLLIDMQAQVEQGNWLKLFLAASPFILLLPDMIPARSAQEAAGMVAEKVAIMTADKALANISKGIAKPDFVTAIQAVDIITLGTLSAPAFSHSLRHGGSKVQYVWQKLAEAYSPKPRKGGGSAPAEEGWSPWSWFE
jgi:hypothetical protein